MVWTLPPSEKDNKDYKIFYNGKPIVIPEDYMEKPRDDIVDPLTLSVNKILQNVSITLNNLIFDIFHNNPNKFKEDRIFYLGIFIIIVGFISTVIKIFVIAAKKSN